MYADTADASTSDANAIPIASKAGIPINVINIGETTAAADSPARPVPSPAPIPAKKHTIIIIRISKPILLRNSIKYESTSEYLYYVLTQAAYLPHETVSPE